METEDAWLLGAAAALWFEVPELEPDGAPEEAVSDEGLVGAVDELPVAVLGAVSSLGGAVPLLPPDVLVGEGDGLDEEEALRASVLWAAPLEDELSLVADGATPLPLGVLALDGDGSGEEELPNGAVLSVAPFDDEPSSYDVVPAPLLTDRLAVADDESDEDEPPDAAGLCLGPFDEVLSDEDVGAAALLPDVSLVDEGDVLEVEPEPDLVDPDEVAADDALCDGLSCGEEAAVDDGPDEVGDGE